MDGVVNGTVEVSLRWSYTYIPPRYSTKTAAQMQAAGAEPPERLTLMPGEEEAMKQSVIAGAPGTEPTPSAGRPRRLHGPQAVSTPVTKKRKPPAEAGLVHGPVASEAAAEVGSAPSGYTEDTGRQSFDPITEEPEGSVISEGTPVPGRAEAVSSGRLETSWQYVPITW